MTDESYPDTTFSQLAQDRADEVYKTRRKIPDILYHYTDAAGLLGMIRSGTVWATDYRFLNDRAEIEHTRNLVRSLVSTRSEAVTDWVEKNFLKAVIKYQSIPPAWDPFVFSLSQEGDDLSQWRGYARDGQGFTIGFDAPSIQRLIENSEPDSDTDYGFVCVEYTDREQRKAMNSLLDGFIAALKRHVASGTRDKAAAIDDAGHWFDWASESYAVVNKHRSFHLEREWRVVEAVPRAGSTGVKVRSSGTRLVRYIKMKLSSVPGKLPIKCIGIGPGFVSREAEFAIGALCAQHGYNPHIYFADTPFRLL